MVKSNKISTITVLFFTAILLISCGGVKQRMAEIEAKQMNIQCPMMISESVRMEKCEALPNLTIKYTATIFGINGNDFSLSGTQLQEMKHSMIGILQNKWQFEQIKKIGYSYQYVYYDETGIPLYEVLITPDDYLYASVGENSG
jgi:hypothetical protein